MYQFKTCIRTSRFREDYFLRHYPDFQNLQQRKYSTVLAEGIK